MTWSCSASIADGEFADSLLAVLEKAADTGGDGRQLVDAVEDALAASVTWPAAADQPGLAVVAFGPARPGPGPDRVRRSLRGDHYGGRHPATGARPAGSAAPVRAELPGDRGPQGSVLGSDRREPDRFRIWTGYPRGGIWTAAPSARGGADLHTRCHRQRTWARPREPEPAPGHCRRPGRGQRRA